MDSYKHLKVGNLYRLENGMSQAYSPLHKDKKHRSHVIQESSIITLTKISKSPNGNSELLLSFVDQDEVVNNAQWGIHVLNWLVSI